MAIFSASVGLILILVLYVGQNVLEQQIRSRIEAEVRYLMFEFEEDGLAELIEETEERIEKSSPERRLKYTIRSPQGEVIFDEIDLSAGRSGWYQWQLPSAHTTAQPFLFYVKPLGNGYSLAVGADLVAVADFRAAIYRSIFFTLLASLLVSALAGFLFGGYISLKLKRIITATQEVSRGRLDTRLRTDSGGYEFELLAVELNRMFQKIDDLLTSLKQVSAGLAHDLRTPLTVIKNRFKQIQNAPEADASLKHSAQQAELDIDEILRHFDAVLLVSELESGELAGCFELIDLVKLIQGLLESYGPLLEEAGITAHATFEQDVSINGNVSLLQRLLVNLLDNALLHAQAPCRLNISLGLQGGKAILLTQNAASPLLTGARGQTTGPSLHPGRKGMGLKIAGAIAKLHGGGLQVDTHGGEFRCRVCFRC